MSLYTVEGCTAWSRAPGGNAVSSTAGIEDTCSPQQITFMTFSVTQVNPRTDPLHHSLCVTTGAHSHPSLPPLAPTPHSYPCLHPSLPPPSSSSLTPTALTFTPRSYPHLHPSLPPSPSPLPPFLTPFPHSHPHLHPSLAPLTRVHCLELTLHSPSPPLLPRFPRLPLCSSLHQVQG